MRRTERDRQQQLDRIERHIVAAAAEIYDIDQAAEFLRISRREMDRKVAAKEIAYTKIGRRITFLKSDLVDYHLTYRIASSREVDQSAMRV